jgi:hypothetical protein
MAPTQTATVKAALQVMISLDTAMVHATDGQFLWLRRLHMTGFNALSIGGRAVGESAQDSNKNTNNIIMTGAHIDACIKVSAAADGANSGRHGTHRVQ